MRRNSHVYNLQTVALSELEVLLDTLYYVNTNLRTSTMVGRVIQGKGVALPIFHSVSI